MKFHFKISFVLSILVFNFLSCVQKQNKNGEKMAENGKYNRLIHAKSPYLQMHADNPVDWYEWGPEALEKAKQENKPLIISIGYASCHWCHVMEHESFMDSATAKLMNDNFVSIKVDREERPDIDQIYMNAAQLLTGQGGWPLNAFALPNGKPFFAGTYFPNKQWKQVVSNVAKAYKSDHDKVVEQAQALTQGIQKQEIINIPANSEMRFTKDGYQDIFVGWKQMIDFKRGGLNSAPKFPMPVGWEFLLQYHYLTGNNKALEAVTTTLTEMSRGGIYDQLAGGFARYSTDAKWFAPHFEKMLYDNGQLVSLYSHAYKVTGDKAYAKVIKESLKFIEDELMSNKGGFYSSISADSDGEEGKFYVWKKKEVEEVLDPKTLKLIEAYFNIEDQGNWEDNNNILFKSKTDEEFAESHQISLKDLYSTLSKAKKKLLKKRNQRIRPETDDKILTGWNALMLKGYIDAYQALGEESYLAIALKNAEFLEKNMIRENGRLWRNYKDGEPAIDAFLEDYALLANAYISLYEVTLDVKWLNIAKKLTGYSIQHFKDEKSGMFFYTSDQSENLVARKMEITDNVIPASNSVMAGVLYKLGEYFYNKNYIKMSTAMLGHVTGNIAENGPYYAGWAQLMGVMAYKPYEVAVMGANAVGVSRELQKHYLPTALFMGGHKENLPLLEGKGATQQTTIYVCQNKTCRLPVFKVEQALEQITN